LHNKVINLDKLIFVTFSDLTILKYMVLNINLSETIFDFFVLFKGKYDIVLLSKIFIVYLVVFCIE